MEQNPIPTIAPELPKPTPTTPPTPERVAKKVIIGCAIFIGVALTLFLCFLALRYYTTNTPEYMLGQALQTLSTQKAVAGDVTVSYNTDSGRKQLDADFISFTDIADAARHELTVGVGEGDGRIEATVRQIESDMSYGRVTNAARLPTFLEEFIPGIRQKFDSAFAKSTLEDVDKTWYQLQATDVSAPQASNARQLAYAAQTPTVYDTQSLALLYQQHPFASITPQDDRYDGGQTFAVMRVQIDQKAFIQYLQVAQQAGALPLLITPQTIQLVEESFKHGTSTVEVWVDRDTRQVGRVILASPGGIRVTVRFAQTIPRGRTAVDRPALVRPYAEANSDLSEIIDIATAPK